ncbi:uncharacterized protein LOC134204237 [Armigeres subalbatus]|uniref:uncharacterized protein LOC134204237 n=1 Tax=Armigeres subalbatus TaxID=124917 RepID=UPI002ED3768A
MARCWLMFSNPAEREKHQSLSISVSLEPANIIVTGMQREQMSMTKVSTLLTLPRAARYGTERLIGVVALNPPNIIFDTKVTRKQKNQVECKRKEVEAISSMVQMKTVVYLGKRTPFCPMSV